MAYSDYGGYAYRNGERVEERSDAVLTTEGIKSTPGLWPGWILPDGRGGNSFHVLLGDGPIYVGLYKQSCVSVFNNGEEVPLVGLVKDQHPPEAIRVYDHDEDKIEYVNEDAFRESKRNLVVSVADHTLEIFWANDDNCYVYARLTQPDGVKWTGWSGYGVGAGLEDAGYGFNTSYREGCAWKHWHVNEEPTP
jgi:hypothetical protein